MKTSPEKPAEGPNRAPRNQQPRLVGFLCMNGSQVFYDVSNPARRKLPAGFTGIAVECISQVHAREIFKALRFGAEGVLLAASPQCPCGHDENEIRQHVAELYRALAGYDIEASRLRLEWISTAEEHKFLQTVNEMMLGLQQLPPLQLFKELGRNLAYCG
ncbi:MAG: hydrogenase iron-sulfur subunit [candidate division KSB1 bacterium]|nr:hydrogenase iron-sulfur subunit [candidate division KSB1 bacterium]MDZ7276664.1 hydrogenase iron-sulfur subunit [candidate division KSB1 bacterium]MDZ7287768.1 hydrogenase iron-sulfur subunit [candidate division KSB1 bacterium]MDZ7299892.1 hydrogenase iron-sulfur subunit [candidate division KSB1 bacterium]MDZ7309499.1 hydrogenase iron-sulfur subunit [candidate division KSB1 bacterium]